MNLAYTGIETLLKEPDFIHLKEALDLILALKSLYKVHVLRSIPITPWWVNFIETKFKEGTLGFNSTINVWRSTSIKAILDVPITFEGTLYPNGFILDFVSHTIPFNCHRDNKPCTVLRFYAVDIIKLVPKKGDKRVGKKRNMIELPWEIIKQSKRFCEYLDKSVF